MTDRLLTPAVVELTQNFVRPIRPQRLAVLEHAGRRTAELREGNVAFLAETANVRSANGRWIPYRRNCWSGAWS